MSTNYEAHVAKGVVRDKIEKIVPRKLMTRGLWMTHHGTNLRLTHDKRRKR